MRLLRAIIDAVVDPDCKSSPLLYHELLHFG
jgi:hypothetical protein